MRVLVVVTAIAAALAIVPTASPGGWATVGFEPLPDGVSAGSTWNPRIFVKQHGVTPLAGLQPVVLIREEQSGAETKVLATPTSEIGVYEADVVFPSQGDWRVTILSGFGDSQVTYGPVEIGRGTTSGGGLPELPVAGIAALVVLVGGFVVIAARRSRRLTPARG
jgi:hypothetical protein